MRKFQIFFMLFLSLQLSFGQRKVDIGLFGGTNYYMGDLNNNKLFTTPGYSLGPIVRYNFNPRYSIRVHSIYSKISGEDIVDNEFVTKRNYPIDFTIGVLNTAAQVEFNFFPYKSNDSKGRGTPYIFGGIGYSVLLSNTVNGSVTKGKNHMTIPFGVGGKINLTNRLSAGIEWSNHKTFTSEIDGVTFPTGETFMSQNDWYSFLGLFITYKFFKFAADCPVYD
jgi:hypothetical protein